MGKRNWTVDEVIYLTQQIRVQTLEQIAKALGRDYDAVRSKARRLNLEIPKGAKANGRPYEESDIAFMRANVGTMDDYEIGAALGRTGQAIKRARQVFKIPREKPKVVDMSDCIEDAGDDIELPRRTIRGVEAWRATATDVDKLALCGVWGNG